ncbi:MAG TPA: D-alanine--D-alanine ligase [Thermoleophilaceae bacterium]|jgi:D-alanine-D-alanine ligase
MGRVAVLKGGSSLERQVSLRSAGRVEDALRRLGHDVVPVDVGSDLVERLRAEAPDAAFVALHGVGGEDGTVQELLEILGIPYTGSGVLACMRSMDKVLAKHLLLDAGIPTPEFFAFNETAFKDLGAAAALPAIEDRLDFPIVVKPAAQGSALGIKFARTPADVPSALVAAFSYDTRVLLERYVRGRDLGVSVLEGAALPVVEAVPQEEDFYDFESRYEFGRTTFVCPAELPEPITARAQALAVATYELLGCHGVARVDIMLEEATSELFVLETNVIPGMTDTSLLPQAAEAAGIAFEALVERMLELAFERDAGRAPV